MRKFGLKAALAALFATFAAPSFAQPAASPTLDAIKARGSLNCGVGTGVAGQYHRPLPTLIARQRG